VSVLRCYRLQTKTLVLRKGVTRPIAMSLPAGSILRVSEDFLNASGLVEVEWEGETVRIFAVDLRDRGEFIQAMSAAGGGR
jgi:hypothetical protein